MMADHSPFPFSRPEYDQWLIQTSREVIEQSRELLERTRPLVEQLGEGLTATPPTNPAEPDSRT
jgi:hypothetical protein